MAALETLLRFPLNCSLPATPADAEQAAFDRHPQNSCNNGDEKADDVQAVILSPVQIMRGDSQMRGSLVSHHKLGPEDRQLQRRERTVQVDLRQLHHVLLVTGERQQSVNNMCRPPSSFTTTLYRKWKCSHLILTSKINNSLFPTFCH